MSVAFPTTSPPAVSIETERFHSEGPPVSNEAPPGPEPLEAIAEPSETERILLSWDALNQATALDPKIPNEALYPSQYPDRLMHKLEPIKKPNGEPWNICGNWMRNPFNRAHKIAVFQHPTPEQITEYWTLIRQHRLFVIDLTSDDDLKKLQNTAAVPFYPPYDSRAYGNINPTTFQIACVRVDEPFREYRICTTDKIFTVPVLHYRNWPDGGAIDVYQLDQLVNVVLQQRAGIHCMAGVGRTGTLVTAAFLKHLIQNRLISKTDFTLEWLNDFILALRRQRSQGWIQTDAQYALLYAYGLALLNMVS